MKKFSIKIINLNNKKINIISKKFKIIYINLINFFNWKLNVILIYTI